LRGRIGVELRQSYVRLGKLALIKYHRYAHSHQLTNKAVECIGKDKAHRRHEFGMKVSIATPLTRAPGGQFVAHVATLLATLMTGIRWPRSLRLWRHDAGFGGHTAPADYSFRMPPSQRRAPLRPEHLAHASDDAINPILAAGYNFSLLLTWLRLLLLRLLTAFGEPAHRRPA
jgi:IS5 family transposase